MRKCQGFRTSRSFLADNGGSIAIVSAFCLFVVIGAAALAVDIGSLYTERRTLQGVADLAAIAGAANIDGAEAEVAATLSSNDVSDATYAVVRGQYKADPAVAPESRFVAGAQPYNAVQVNLRRLGQTYFAKVFTSQEMNLNVSATASTANGASFSIGSRLLALRGGIANQLLGQLLGTTVSLSVMDYEALIQADIEALQFIKALGTRMSVTGGTYDDVLKSSATVGDVVAAAAVVTEANGHANATAALHRMGQSGSLTKSVPLGSLIALGRYGSLSLDDPYPGVTTAVGVMQIISGSVMLANARHQVEVDLAANVPGLLELKLWVGVGEPPQHSPLIAIGQLGSTVRTVQTRIRLDAAIGGSGVLQGIKINLPVYADIAYGEARLADVSCSGGGSAATIAARSGVVDAWIGRANPSDLSDFSSLAHVYPAKLIDTALIDATAVAHAKIGNNTETMLNFDSDDVSNKTIKRTETSEFAQSLVSGLLNDLSLTLNVGGLALLVPPGLTAALRSTLTLAAPPIDQALNAVLATLGLHLGEADIRVHGIRCGVGAGLSG